MKIKAINKVQSSAIPICVLLLSFIVISTLYAQDMTHVVKQGDTLWSICEEYYGDTDLWPKLWQMNPYITNPHLLEPGDTIILLEKQPVKKMEPPPMVEKMVKEEEINVPAVEGISVKGITDIATVGFLSLGQMETSGKIILSENARLVLGEGDTVFVVVNKDVNPKIGDEYSIIKPSPFLKDPMTNEKMGYTFSVHGRLVLLEKTGQVLFKGEMSKKDTTFKAEIIESFESVSVGEELIPFEPVSPCVLPAPSKKEFIGNIVAVQNQQQILAEGTVAYLNRGFNHGVRRGNFFDVVRTNLMNDPKPDQTVYLIDQKPVLILPDIPIGAILVLESRPDTSTALVVHAEENMENGAYITTMDEDRYSSILASMPKCQIE